MASEISDPTKRFDDFLAHDGEMGDRIRTFDWTTTPLGQLDRWPQSLKTLIGVMLGANQPMFVAWGPERTIIYNDAYVDVLAKKHPALGKDFLEVWPEIRLELEPLVARAYQGVPSHGEDIELLMRRKGYPEKTHWAYSYTPVYDKSGAVAGFFCACHEITGQVLAERRQRLLVELGQTLSGADDAHDAMLAAVTLLGQHLGANRVGYGEVQPDGNTVVLHSCFADGVAPLDGSYRLDIFGSEMIAKQRRGLTQWSDDISSDPGQDPAVWAAIDTRAFASVPLIRDGRFVASLYVNFGEPHLWTPDEIELIEQVAVRTWSEVQRARAERALRESEARLRFLSELDEGLRASSDAPAAMHAAAELLARRLGTSRCAYAAVDSDNDSFVIHDDYTVPGLASSAGNYSLDLFGPRAAADMRGGQTLVIRHVSGELAPGEGREMFKAIDIEAVVCCPLVKEGQLVAMMAVHQDRPRDWHSDEIALIQTVVERCWSHVERVGAEARLRASEARFRGVFDSRLTGLTLFDTWSGETLAINDTFLAMTGHTRADFQEGRWDWREFTVPEYFHLDETAIAQARARGWWDTYEKEYSRRDGTTFPVRIASAPLPSEPGRVVVAVEDISAQRAAHAALRQSEERLRLATEHAEVGFWDVDEINQTLHWPPIVKAMFGISPEVPVSMADFYGGLHPDDAPATTAAYLAAADPGCRALYDVEYRTVGKEDGVIRWVAAKGRGVFDEDGRCLRVVGTAIDITRRKVMEQQLRELNESLEQRVAAEVAERSKAEEALRQAQKMEAMGQLTGGVAHDFNNLLTPIVGALDRIQRKGLGGEREQRLIAGAAQSAERAKILVQRLLAFARRQPLQAVAVDVAKLVNGMGDLVSSTTGPQIRVVVEAPEGLPAALADPNQIEMALLNLAVNARDAMPEGGTLRISAGVEHVGPGHRTRLRPETYICLSVADTGIGMDEATLTRAVEPFFSTKGIGKGTGLGLSMVHGLASQLGGALTIQSGLGLGTNVELWLPQSAAVPEAAEAAPEPLVTHARGTALLVDDEEYVRLSTADMLHDLGYAVIEASSAEEASHFVVRGERFDLLVTDHLMPGMSGTDLAHCVRSLRPGIPILLVSGYAEHEGIAPDLPLLSKPFRKDELAAALAQLSPMLA